MQKKLLNFFNTQTHQEQRPKSGQPPRSAEELFKKMKKKIMFAVAMIKAANRAKKQRIKGSLNNIDNSPVFLKQRILQYFKVKHFNPEDKLVTPDIVAGIVGIDQNIHHQRSKSQLLPPINQKKPNDDRLATNYFNYVESQDKLKLQEQALQFDIDQLVMWFHRNIKIFRPIQGARRVTNPILKLVRRKPLYSKRSSFVLDNQKRRSSIASLGHKRTSSVGRIRDPSQSNLVESEYIRDEIEVTLDKVQQSYNIRTQIGPSFNEIRSKLLYMDGMKGNNGQKQAIKRLQQTKAKKLRGEQEMLNYIVKNEPDARQASNLHRLLSKRWNEQRQNFKILSPLTQLQKLKVNTLLDNRFK